MSQAYDNPTFTNDKLESSTNSTLAFTIEHKSAANATTQRHNRDTWGKEIEFLLSCIAMAVGLGNVWRFPFIALKNGGGAFVIPYIIILILVGKPGYFLEMIMGQFSSRGTVKVYDCVPAMRGVGIGQTLCIMVVATYYSSIMAITMRYLFDSFSFILPWSECNPSWVNVSCYPSSGSARGTNTTWDDSTKSSAELYFLKDVLHAKENIDDGIGMPNWNLVGFLILSWVIVFFILFKGIKSSGKAAYVTGITPFIFLLVFLIRALTLPGAFDGIAYFFTPKWEDILKPAVWFNACTQVFFTLNVFFVNVIMYASYNKFEHNIHRDSNIVTTLDTFTSILVGSITFGIVGHLSHELDKPISNVFQDGPGLVFVTYPETIAKFKFMPQIFSVLFFLMLYILALGSLLAITSSAITVIRDQFKNVKDWQAALGFAIYGILFGSVYTTPGGQSVLNLVDSYCATFVIFILACFEIYTFCYIYGVERICNDVKFMLGFRPNIFWRFTWKYITPAIMTGIVIYVFANFELPKDDKKRDYQPIAHVIGWLIASMGLIWLPLTFVLRVLKQTQEITVIGKIKAALEPTTNWGPLNPGIKAKYREYMATN